MSIALADALLGWLVAAAGDNLRRLLRGDPTRVALRRVVEEAVTATVAEVAADLDSDQIEHLHSSLLVQEIGPASEQPPISTEAELRDAVHAWTAVLDEARFGGLGYLSGLGLERGRLADALTETIVVGIHRDARSGGGLNGLAEWLWRDGVVHRLARIEDKIDARVGPAGSAYGGLPGGTPDFTGRQQVLYDLAQRIEAHDPAGIVVAIHAVDGMAGVGKTELALRAAHQHKYRYPDGQYFLNLHGYTEGLPPMPPLAALGELLRQAGMSGQTVPPDLAGRQTRWRSLMATRQALVLLDNALDSDHVRPLLPHSAGSLVLITSRTRLLGLPGTRPLRLDVLPSAEAAELFIRLVDTARPVDPHVVATVVHLVGRLPVAIQALAALVDDNYTETDLADELANADAGVGLVDEASELDVGVRAAFETSLRRLDRPHQRAFRLLGVHPGPSVGAPQFAALVGLPIASAHAMLRGLANRNLIMASGDRVGHHRYQMHDLMRAFARWQASSRLTANERSAAIGRLTRWYAAAMSTVARLREGLGSNPGRSGVEGLALDRPADAHQWLASEQDNLLALAETATGAPAAAVCQQAARNFYDLAYYTTAEVLYRTAANGYRQTGNRRGEVGAEQGLGNIALATGNYLGAAEHYRIVLQISGKIRDGRGEAAARRRLGQIAELTGDNLGAAEHYQAAQQVSGKNGDRNGVAAAQRRLGNVTQAAGDYPGAAEHFRAALDTYAEIGNPRGEAGAHRSLGDIALATGDNLGATEHYSAAMSISGTLGDRRGETAAQRRLGDVARTAGDYAGAVDHYSTALRTYGEIGDRREEADIRRRLGQMARATGDYAGAVEHYSTALHIYGEIGDRRGWADIRRRLGQVAELTSDYAGAVEHLDTALQTYTEIRNRGGEAATRLGLGDVALALGDHPGAAESYQIALQIFGEVGDKRGEADARRRLGQMARATGDYAGAVEHHSAALHIYGEIGNRRGEAQARWGLGDVVDEQGRRNEAREHWGEALRIFEEIGDLLAAPLRKKVGASRFRNEHEY